MGETVEMVMLVYQLLLTVAVQHTVNYQNP